MARWRRCHRVQPEAWRALPLRAHELLADVPLHDVWCVPLGQCREPVELSAVLEVARGVAPATLGGATRGLFATRRMLGRVFGWDRAPRGVDSYSTRLTEADRRRSLDAAGADTQGFRLLYRFEKEALWEVLNRTVHAFIGVATHEEGDASYLYAAVFVAPVGPVTRHYMALVDPFRRVVVYPALIRAFEAAWSKRVAG